MPANSSFNSSLHLSLDDCVGFGPSIFIFAAVFATITLLLPLYILVACMGFQRWGRRRSVSAAVTTSHSDVFTYNVVALELISVLGCCFYCGGALTDTHSITSVGMDIFTITSPGETLFHLLTCVERYLAVVHPVTYLGLRQAGGVRIRNISVGCVWLLCFGFLALTKVFGSTFACVAASCLLVFSLMVVSFCSLFVLGVLKRPGPGEGGGDRKHVDQSKQRAFHTITAIMGALLFRFVGILVSSVASLLTHAKCVVLWSTAWLTLPGSLVLPLLFLHRAGKLPGSKQQH